MRRPLPRQLSPLRLLTATALVCAGITAGPSPAAARLPSSDVPVALPVTGTVSDPDDTPGPLDIARVRHRVAEPHPGRVRVTYRVRTFERFDAARLNRDHRHFVLELNQDGEAGSERNVRISSVDGSLVAELISNATRRVLATVHVERVSDRAIRIAGRRNLIGARAYFWYSNFHARRSAHCGFDGYPVTCQDDVPHRGWIRLDRRGWPTER